MTGTIPREGMMAVIRNRRAMILGVQPFDAAEAGRFHLVEVEYTDGTGAESDELLWEVEPGRDVHEPLALPPVERTAPMDPRELDAMVRASRWSALTPSLPFSGLDADRPPLAAPLYGAIHPEAYQLVPVLRALEMPRVALLLADAVGLGKTIQAGMVLRELMLRRRIRRVLVLCPKARLADNSFCRRLDPKGFWRVDKTQDAELRHTVLSLAAFDDLQAAIAAAGDRDAGIQAFCDQNEGDGWMLPETLCLADLGLTRTVDAGEYDERARTPQPVRSRLGERFLDWQLAQTPEESWAECERHAKAILEGMPEAPVATPDTTPKEVQTSLFDLDS